ncbi:MAG: MarR family transcriptional regulator [Gordonia sp. (in: high G+C Gram-positive bacteria)]
MTESADIESVGELRRWVTRLYLALRRHSPSDELTAANSSAIATLLDHGPMRMGEFAERESIRLPSATALIDSLVRKGQVQRSADPDDRRAVLVELTAHGRELVAEARIKRDVALTTAFESLSPEHQAALLAATPALAALHAQLGKPPINNA